MIHMVHVAKLCIILLLVLLFNYISALREKKIRALYFTFKMFSVCPKAQYVPCINQFKQKFMIKRIILSLLN